VFGFALGLLFSALFRRVLPAAPVTLVAFVGVRFLVGTFRFDYLPPVRTVQPFTGYGPEMPGILVQDEGDLFASGQPVTVMPPGCQGTAGQVFPDWVACMRQHGVTQQYLDYQPADRIGTYRLIECVVFLALAVVCGLVTWLRTRRAD
jgi:hypothetical protein